MACEHETRRVIRQEHDGSITVIANRFQGQRLNRPNDLIGKSDGAIYFTDPMGFVPAHEIRDDGAGIGVGGVNTLAPTSSPPDNLRKSRRYDYSVIDKLRPSLAAPLLGWRSRGCH